VAVGIWDVKLDEERVQWVFSPFAGVGPLRFGMSAPEVRTALDGARAGVARGHFPDRSEEKFDLGVTVYYADHARVAGVAVDGLRGPQVRLAGVALVGQVPSAAEEWLTDRCTSDDLGLCYMHEGTAGSTGLGLLLRVQRAGDAMVTRPVFLAREWAERVWWDVIPASEWQTFC
jgi:hypothetical protein